MSPDASGTRAPVDPPHWDSVPGTMQQLDRWIGWREAWVPGEKGRPGRWAKQPNKAGSLFPASPLAPRNWCSFVLLKVIFERGVGHSGAGFVLGDLGNGWWLVGFDIDTCLDAEGVPYPWAKPLLDYLAPRAYLELSPSRTGVKCFAVVRGDNLAAVKAALSIGDRWVRTGTIGEKPEGGLHQPGVQIFIKSKYFTVTGWRCPGALEDVAELTPAMFHDLFPLLPAEGGTKGGTKAHKAGSGRRARDDSRSGKAFRVGRDMLRAGVVTTADGLREALCNDEDPDVKEWAEEVEDRQIENIIKNAEKYDEPDPDEGGGGGGGDDGSGGGGGGKPKPPPWFRLLLRDGHYVPRPILENAVVALSHAPELAGLVAYDDMDRAVMVMGKIPGSEHVHATLPRRFEDVDASEIQRWLQRYGRMPKMSRETVFQAAEVVAKNHRFDPVLDYLDGLAWDGVGRIDTWLTRYLGVEETAYTRAVGAMTLIAIAARSYSPGCQCDYMMVLEGQQGDEKSKAFRVLASDAWFDDHLPDLQRQDVRTSMHMRGKMIIEAAELSAMRNADIEKLKAFITRRSERYVPLHARTPVVEHRRCVLFGTTNKEAYLHDETGNRRFWPVKAGKVDIAALILDRDQLFAEAVVRYRAGEQWWPDREFEAEHFAPEQEGRYEVDVWEEIILAKLADGSPQTVGQAAINVKDRLGNLTKADQNRITAIMERAGWQRAHKRDAQGNKVWIPPGTPNPKPTKPGSRRSMAALEPKKSKF